MINHKEAKDWTQQHVESFWNWYVSSPHRAETYFSKKIAKGIIKFLQYTGYLHGCILDYGCGPGDLLKTFLTSGLTCSGIDSSESSVKKLNQELLHVPGWQGALLSKTLPSTLPTAEFDVVTCIETIEHLPSPILEEVLCDIYRIVKPGGIAFITTPYAQDLSVDLTFCPFCSAEFHSMQHFNSFSKESLTTILQKTGFEVLFCSNLDLEHFQNERKLPDLLHLSISNVACWIHDLQVLLFDILWPRSFPYGRMFQRLLKTGRAPHLCAVVTPSKPHSNNH